ncbi:formate dehydrogenase subunit gamma [Dongia sp.]|uniref:formate dehydrogenase subunit gamma n=1 Tax=Dongia sp. TaxID=1977262 RepID=UPI0035B42018
MSGLAAAKSAVRSWDKDAALSIVQEKKSLDGALMPILHALNDEFGYVDASIVPVIADELNLSRAEVHGVLSFYHDFRKEPAGRHVVKICRAEACQSMQGRELEEHIKRHLKVELGETSADKKICFEAVYCLGLCACAPSMMVDGKLHGRVTPEKFDRIMAQKMAGAR